MQLDDLKAKYGNKNSKRRELFNRAIRAELVGGEDALNALDLLLRVQLRLGEHNLPTQRASAAVAACLALRDEFGDVIARRYGLQPKGDDR